MKLKSLYFFTWCFMSIPALHAQDLLTYSKKYEPQGLTTEETFSRVSAWYYQRFPDSAQAIVGGNATSGWRIEAFPDITYKGASSERFDGKIDFKIVVLIVGNSVQMDVTDFYHSGLNATMAYATKDKKAPFPGMGTTKEKNTEWSHLKDRICAAGDSLFAELGMALKK